jgi:hypothetical protein
MTAQPFTGSHSLLKSLEYEGTETIFGVPGGAILPAYDPLLDSPIRHVLARHEQGAGHMAEGYAMATGRVGVAMATSGPGATNLITPLQNAKMDSTPLVAITGQVGTAAIGSDAFQEAYTTGLAMHCTKHSYLVTDADHIPDVVHEAFHIASSGRPGPVLVDIPKDVLNQHTKMVHAHPRRSPRIQTAFVGRTPEADQSRDRPHRECRAPGALRRWRSHPLRRLRRASRLRRGRQRARRHHADGARSLPRRPPAGPRDARHARHLHRNHSDSKVGCSGQPGSALRRPRHR